jgi:hypothetical protein
MPKLGAGEIELATKQCMTNDSPQKTIANRKLESKTLQRSAAFQLKLAIALLIVMAPILKGQHAYADTIPSSLSYLLLPHYKPNQIKYSTLQNI